MTKERERLIKELKRIMPCCCLEDYKKRNMCDPNCSWCGYGEDIASFIIKNRERIVQPLVKLGNLYPSEIKEAIDQTLKLALGEEGV